MILVSGAAGALGGLIVDRLGDAAVAGTRSPDDLGRPARRVDFDDPASLDLDGVRTLVLISAGAAEDDTVIARHGAAIDAAEKAGVDHIVYTSVTGAGDHLAFALAHRWTEGRLRSGLAAWTILRNGLYAELLAQLTTPVDGVINASLGDGRLAAVARADLADAAVAVAREPAPHAGRIYELVGDRALGASEIAAARGATYRPATAAEARQQLASLPMPAFQVPMVMSIYSSVAAGILADTTSDLPGLLGRPPRDALELITSM